MESILTCWLLMIIFYLPWHYSIDIDLKCPDPSQWNLRGNSYCNKTGESYFCLYDENQMAFTEFCKDEPSFDAPGYKIVLVGQLHGVPCTKERFQPFKYWTNGSYNCVYEKSLCNEEGQIVFKNRTKISDRTCRCDYSKGYDFVVKPKDGCECIPSEEDCSCYHKTCQTGFILSPDYQCILPTEWNANFFCPIITDTVEVIINKDIVPPIKTIDSDTDHSRNILGLEIIIISTIVLILIVSSMITVISQNEYKLSQEYQELRQKISKSDRTMSQNIKDLQKNEKKSWVKKLEHFVETKASTKVLETIKKEQCIMITGPFGSGKSMTVFYVALRLEDVSGFDIMIVSDLDDIIKYATDKKKQLFVIDDMFGKYALNDHNTGWWSRHGNLVKQVLSKNVNMKLLMTSRSRIYQPTILDNIDLSYVHCNLISDNLKLTVEERRKIVQSYHSDLNDRLSDEVIMMYNFFPSLCGTLPEAAVKRYDEYFKIPYTFLFAEMQRFKAYDVDYIALALLVVKDDNVDSNILKDVNEKENKLLNDLSTELCHTICPHKQLLLESLSKLDGTYVKKTDNGCTCIHKNLFDIIAFCIGSSIIRTVLKHGSSSFIKERLQFKSLNVKHDPLTIMLPPENEDLYFKRLLIDMKKGLVWDVFSSLQSSFPEFREKLIAYMQEHRKVLYLNDGNNGSTVLHVAAAKGYSDYASFFIEVEKNKVNREDKSGKIPLHLACEKGHFGMAKLLLDNRAFFDKTDKDEQTPLDIACSKGYSEIVNLLLEKRARIKQRNKDLRTALHVSANNGNITITKLLLKHDAKVNITDKNGYTPLHLAAMKDHVDIINLLLEYKADIDCCDNTGKTPLFIACHKKKFSAASDLIKHQADINKTSLENDSPLHAACQTGCKEIVQLLLDQKVDYNQRNKSGNMPLHVACENGNLDCVGILLQFSSKGGINKGNKDKSTPLHLACQSGRKDVVTFLLENGASINQGDKQETTPLFESCRKGDGHITELLLQHGSDVNKSDKYGWTPLFISCEKGHSQIVASLLDHKADVNHADVDNLRPILIACRAGHIDILNLLLQCKADINVSDNDGVTPLSSACERNQKDIVEFLLSKEASVNQSDKDGSTSLHIACGEGYADLVDILLKYHASVDQADRFGQTPLFKSISIRNVSILETLLKKGASANISDRFKMSPLSVASQKGYTEIVKIIRKYSPAKQNGNPLV